MEELGQPRFRAEQVVQWLYRQGAADYGEMTNLPLSLRETLEGEHPLRSARVVDRQESRDGTRKYLVELADGSRVETVAIPALSSARPASAQSASVEHPSSQEFSLGRSPSQPSSAKRLTVCFSTQIGCAMACAFCATGTEGFTRNLLPGEIVDQVLMAQKDFGVRASNLVAMGQGEPFLNYENTLAALRILNSPKGLAVGARRITISTCGIISGIERLSGEPEQFTLAVSLHSAEQRVRDRLMPKLAGEPLPLLKETLLGYVRRTNRRVSLEYILVDGINDTPAALDALVQFCSGLLCHVNLLPMNAVPQGSAVSGGSTASDRSASSGGSASSDRGAVSGGGMSSDRFDNMASSRTISADVVPGFRPSDSSVFQAWSARLEEERVPVTVRQSRGSDIAGACGQLKNTLSEQHPSPAK